MKASFVVTYLSKALFGASPGRTGVFFQPGIFFNGDDF